jgi:hypothetical protein
VIAKISRARDPAAMARYVFGPGREEEHVDARVIAGNIAASDERQVREALRGQARLRPELERCSYHVALAAAPEDRRMADGEWAQISGRFAADMGLDACAWVAVRHDDPEQDGREHVHLLAVAVTDEGKRWNDSLDRPRAIQAARAIEAEHGLALADAPERRGYSDATTPQTARRAARREMEVPDKQRARTGLERALERCDGTWQGLSETAEREGIGLQYRMRDGQVKGVGVSIERSDGEGARTFKASALHRSLSAAGIEQRLQDRSQAIEQGRDRGREMGW